MLSYRPPLLPGRPRSPPRRRLAGGYDARVFASALALARGFTRPAVVSVRSSAGRVDSSLGAIVLVNEEGWFVSAAHVLANVVSPPSGVTNVSPWFGDDRFRLAE